MEWGFTKEAAIMIEGLKKKGTRTYFKECGIQNPSFTGTYISLNGKGDVFCSGGSCHGIGFGTGEAITSADIDAIENFVRKKRADNTLFMEITPFADDFLLKRLQTLVYTVDHFLNVWVVDLNQWQPSPSRGNTDEKVRVENVDDSNIHEWAWTVALGLSNDDYQADVSVESVKAFSRNSENMAFVVKEAGVCSAGGCMTIEGQLAELFMTATLPTKRRKGFQSLLIDERLSYAKAAGCTHATVTTKPNTSSARNVIRSGFYLAYNKAVLRSPQID